MLVRVGRLLVAVAEAERVVVLELVRRLRVDARQRLPLAAARAGGGARRRRALVVGRRRRRFDAERAGLLAALKEVRVR